MIDVHIIKHPTQDRSATLEPLLEQLEREPVKVHFVDGVRGCIGLGRHRGFQMGRRSIVSYLDDDDQIVPGIFDKIQEEFQRNKHIDALCTRECRPDGSQSRFPFKYYDKRHFLRIHHITAYRRKSIKHLTADIVRCPRNSEHTLAALMMLEGQVVKHLPEVGYVWAPHEGSSPSTCGGFTKESLNIYRRVMEMAKAENYESHIPDQGVL